MTDGRSVDCFSVIEKIVHAFVDTPNLAHVFGVGLLLMIVDHRP